MKAFTDARGPVAAPTQLGADFMPLSGTSPVLGAIPSKDIRAVFAHHNFTNRGRGAGGRVEAVVCDQFKRAATAQPRTASAQPRHHPHPHQHAAHVTYNSV